METIHIEHPNQIPTTAGSTPCVLALGFFDGVHIGHRGILEAARSAARKKGYQFNVMTFYPHPKDILFPEREPMTYLTPLPVKEERFQEIGVDQLFIVKFTPEFAKLSPEDFIEHYIVNLHCKHVVAGFDYHYGHKGKGNMKTLTEAGYGKFEVTTVQKIEQQAEKISSTAVRELLATGKVEKASDLLGQSYEVRGKVKQNSLFYKNHQFIKVDINQDYRLPKLGVYRVEAEIEGRSYEGICHQMTVIGRQPFLLIQLKECFADTYGKKVNIKWLKYMFGKQKETAEVNDYIQREDMVI
ncbi:riboflavin biosynthesis protein RibF [Bacillus sp. PK3_68]|uniref:riboflavin biosynthesis protein RibF n=1 Tax=Bacillus sp. PK3_68 TaxID=2027408 RepID=UPI000E71057D|nr:riboflavin biosynthesis protein RibF [Bacillus sp. PK3_68]RJS60262.1 riboflavin biosynthesis protein RibF [Bacillus sp. PK3_68]